MEKSTFCGKKDGKFEAVLHVTVLYFGLIVPLDIDLPTLRHVSIYPLYF
jgi:hypothetical protein